MPRESPTLCARTSGCMLYLVIISRRIYGRKKELRAKLPDKKPDSNNKHSENGTVDMDIKIPDYDLIDMSGCKTDIPDVVVGLRKGNVNYWPDKDGIVRIPKGTPDDATKTPEDK